MALLQVVCGDNFNKMSGAVYKALLLNMHGSFAKYIRLFFQVCMALLQVVCGDNFNKMSGAVSTALLRIYTALFKNVYGSFAGGVWRRLQRD